MNTYQSNASETEHHDLQKPVKSSSANDLTASINDALSVNEFIGELPKIKNKSNNNISVVKGNFAKYNHAQMQYVA